MGSTRCRCGGEYFRVFRVSLLVVLCVEVFALAALFVLAGRVLACEPGSGEEIVLEKNQPAGAETYFDTSWFPGVDQGQGGLAWFGPCPGDAGPDDPVFLPEGVSTITLMAWGGEGVPAAHTLRVTVEPAFDILTVPFRKKAVVSWGRIYGATRYEVYRSGGPDPSRFEKVAALGPAATVFTDTGLDDATYFYTVGALVDGMWRFSRVRGVHPYAVLPRANYAPVIHSAPVTCATAGVAYTYDVNAEDPFRDRLTYSLVSPPAGMTIDAETGLITWTPQEYGDYEIVVRVKDCKGLSDTQTFVVEVVELAAPNTDPHADAGGPYEAAAGAGLVFDGTRSYDPDGDALEFIWDFGDGARGGGPRPVHAYAEPGVYTVRLVVSDGRGGTGQDTTSATVRVCEPPSASLTASPPAVAPGETSTLVWSTSNATDVSIDHGIGHVGLSGTIAVNPSETTTYTLTATGPCGTASRSATVMVHRAPRVDIVANPQTVVQGQPSTLTWTSADALAVEIDRGIGAVPASGSLAVSPHTTTTYTITATGPGGTATDAATVTVLEPPVVSMTAEPGLVARGEASTLTWTSQNATWAGLDNGIGQVDPVGSVEVRPLESTVYTITVQGPGGTASASARVEVVPVPTVTITADPNPIDRGGSTILSWVSQNAQSAAIDQGIGTVPPEGELEVDPEETTTYTITAAGPGGTAKASVTVQVNEGQGDDSDRVYIANQGSNDVTAIDPASNEVVARVGVGGTPYGVDAGPDGKRVYVTTAGAGIHVIDTATNTVEAVIPVDATTVAASPDGKIVYAVSTESGVLTAFDAETLEVLGSAHAGAMPRAIAVAPDEGKLYVGSLADGSIRVFDARSLEMRGTVAGMDPGAAVCDLEVSPDGTRLYAVSDSSCTLTVIDTRTNRIVDDRHYLIERTPDDVFLAVSPDGRSLYLSYFRNGGSVLAIDAASLDVSDVTVLGYPSDMSFTSGGSSLYIPDAWYDSVAVVGADGRGVIAMVEGAFSEPYTCGHFVAQRRERIEGRVMFGDQGVEGIAVTLQGQGFRKVFHTDAQGRYFFYARPGRYTLGFAQDGFVFSRLSNDVVVTDRGVTVPEVGVVLGASLSAEPEVIRAGGSAVLRWVTLGAASADIEPGLGAVASGGSAAVSPDQTTTYTLTARDSQGRSVSQSVTVQVAMPPVVSLTADPPAIARGQATTLSWSCSGADTVRLEPFGWDVESAGTYTVLPSMTTTYRIVATGPGGTNDASVTVTVHLPPTAGIRVDPQAIYRGQSATLSWTSSGADTVSLDNGIGAVEASGSMTVSPSATTTYTLTAAGPGGTASASVTLTVNRVISLTVDSPAAGAVVHRPDVLVQGTVHHAYDYETGVTVNGVSAFVYGDRFVANHVPLSPGTNRIVVTASDAWGNSSTGEISVVSEVDRPYVTLSVDDPMGVSPYETVLRLESFFEVESVTLEDTGQGCIRYEQGEGPDERVAHIDEEGLFLITAGTANGGTVYADTIGVVVYDRDDLDARLSQKWGAMLAALRGGDVDAAARSFTGRTHRVFRNAFSYLSPGRRVLLADELADIRFIRTRGSTVEYDIQVEKDGTVYSYCLLFEMDEDGIWRIGRF